MRAFLFLVAMLPLWAQPPPRLAPQTPPADPAQFGGQVVDQVTGAPVKKAMVRMYGPQGGDSTAITGTAGRFVIRELPPGHYYIEARHKAYPAGRLGPPQRFVDLKPKEENSDFAISLTPGATLTGQVVDEDGEPAPGCQLMLFQFDYQNGGKQLVHAKSASTNDRGEYRMFHVPPGKYFLRVRRRGALLAPRPYAPRGARLDLPREAHAALFYPGVPTFEEAQVLELTPGEHRQAIDFRLSRIPVTDVHGQIAGPDDGWRKARFRVQLLADTSPLLGQATRSASGSVRGPTGKFQIPAVAAGSYWLYVYESGDPIRYGSRQRVEIGGLSVDLVARLHRTREFSGEVELDGDPKEAVKAQRIWLEPTNNRHFGRPSDAEVTDGQFVLKHVLPGRWRLRAALNGPGYLKSAWLDGQELDPSNFSLPAAGAGPLRIVLSTRLARVEGKVFETTSGEGAGWVALIPDGESADLNDYTRVVAATIQPDGHFQPQPVPPGDYRLFAFPTSVPHDPHRLIRNFELREAIHDRGERITLTEGATARSTLRYIPTDLLDRFDSR